MQHPSHRYRYKKIDHEFVTNFEFYQEFLFSCLTGLAYADVKKLKKTEIVKGPDGEMWIFTKRQKTDIPTRVPLINISPSEKENEYLKPEYGIAGTKEQL